MEGREWREETRVSLIQDTKRAPGAVGLQVKEGRGGYVFHRHCKEATFFHRHCETVEDGRGNPLTTSAEPRVNRPSFTYNGEIATGPPGLRDDREVTTRTPDLHCGPRNDGEYAGPPIRRRGHQMWCPGTFQDDFACFPFSP